MSIPKLRQNERKMKPTLANLFNTIATLIYLNVYCFLFVSLKCYDRCRYAFVCIMRGEGSVFRISKEVGSLFQCYTR